MLIQPRAVAEHHAGLRLLVEVLGQREAALPETKRERERVTLYYNIM